MTTKKKPKPKPPTATAPLHPLLKEAVERYNDSWIDLSTALGYSAPSQVYTWRKNPTKFGDKVQKRVRDLLDGKPLRPLKANGHDLGKGELGLAILTIPHPIVTQVADVAQPMGGRSVFQKRLSEETWLVVYHFKQPGDLMAFKSWAASRTKITTP